MLGKVCWQKYDLVESLIADPLIWFSFVSIKRQSNNGRVQISAQSLDRVQISTQGLDYVQISAQGLDRVQISAQGLDHVIFRSHIVAPGLCSFTSMHQGSDGG